MHCAICSRPMQSASVYIGVYPVGPQCARRAGLLKMAARGNNRLLKLAKPARRARDEAQMEMDLEVGNADQA